jgi:DNA-binding NarL/FixJ family response regulator
MLSEHGQPHDQPGPSATAVEEVRVLIVDDHACFADLLSCALDAVDGIHCVGVASSAAEGLQRVAELAPSVVVMDISMPGLDGLAATRQLRQTSPGTAVAVVTAHTEADWIARAARAGASAYIAKGGSLAEMIAVLKAARPGQMVVAASVRPAPSAGARPEEGALHAKSPVRVLDRLSRLRLFGA